MAEDTTTPDADFEDTGEKVAGPIASALDDSIRTRFEKVMGGELRGDKTVDILRSVEKLMFVQTEFLSSISNALDDQYSLSKDTIEDQERESKLKDVSEGGDKPEKGEGFGSKMMGAVTEKLDMGDGPGGFAKKLGIGLLAGFGAKGFFKSLGSGLMEKLGFSKETSEKGGEAAGNGGMLGTLTALFTKGGPLKKMKGGIQGFVAGTVGSLVYDTISGFDADKDGKLLGLKKELVAGTGAAIAGVGSFIATGKALSKAGNAIKSAVGITPKPPVPGGGGGSPAKIPKADAPKPPKTPKVTTPKTPVAKIPGASTITTSGKAAQGKPTTIRGVLGKLPAEKAAKFARFFRVAGPLGAVIPALLEPAMAIYNDEPEAVVRKQTAGALGSIGGGALGALAGGSLGTMLFPGIGSGIGAGIGGLFGAISGEWLIEKMIGAIFDGKDLKEGDLKSESKKNTRVRGGRKGSAPTESPSKAPSASATAKKPPSASATAKIESTGPSVEEAQNQLTSAKAAFAEAEKDDTLRETLEGEKKYSLLKADVAFAEQDLADANARAGANGDFVKRKRGAPKSIMEVAGIESAPEKLAGKTQAIASNQMAKEQATAASIQQNVAKGGDTVTTNTVGGNSTTFNIIKGGGSGSLGNPSHLPVLQSG